MQVRVRFAPSPTGFLHVGGARTAIFNWLFAKSKNGKFLVRIEDTDAERSKSELTLQIIRSLDWLKIPPDGEIVYQSDNLSRYKEIVSLLIKEKKAYYCFDSPQELDIKRKLSFQNKIPLKFYRDNLNLSEDVIHRYIKENKPHTVRFFVPDGKTTFVDLVHGETSFINSEVEDFIILRSDGSPVYQIAVVVDDNDMGITHVIRGDDHLSNTPKQILLYEALGWNIPLFAHLPLIHDEDNKKLSKRRNTVSVEVYQSLGYLPEALFNFLTLLGYAPPDNKEIISRNELVEIFSFDRVNKKSAVFDLKKLNWINSEYIKTADENEMALILRNILKSIMPDEKLNSISDNYLISVTRLMKERISRIKDIPEKGIYFFMEPESYDPIAVEKHWNKTMSGILKDYLEIIRKDENSFQPGLLEEELRSFTAVKNIKTGDLIHCLRLALTGSMASPGIFDLMHVLKKETVIVRITKFIESHKFVL
jgi:glutamyl-tRNA synthetase